MTESVPAEADPDLPSANPFERLMVFDRLAVGPVRLEPRRMIVPYRIFQGGTSDQTEFIYRYEEDVFDPQEPESLNLAAMMAVQPALNYGLFCREIAFYGLFDNADRRLIRSMADNTAREIYVKKFLEPNPFLTGDAARLKAVKAPSYLKAQLVFIDSGADRKNVPWKLWPNERNRYCILSSGGKDSLLSFALMDEITAQEPSPSGAVHPIFVNESGRHWFTALNAYRYFKAHVPNTARVWVNSDRIFNWMLKQMPFIRKDFADIRSDEYPIRLWTVAVFLFGVLPLMRKRGIGRLLIGDEFDTSRRSQHQGISHYDGLYDQSIYFDHALSRYFLQKGWAISQFSVLRPLSELMIEKILAIRYPKIQQLQTSCHAAHSENDRIFPCGRCEKCRRIVGMLLAIGADPKNCGYSERQIENCLKALTTRGVHQESADQQQLYFMLHEKGALTVPASRKKELRQRPEVLKLRFDSDRSPIHTVPADLRIPLFRIFLDHASGAVRREGRKWIDVDLFSDPRLHQAYPFEVDAVSRGASGAPESNHPQPSPVWGELTWPEAAHRLQKVDIALLPVGAIEQHGPHLPLDTDAFDAAYLADRVANACSDPKPLVLPLIPFGVSYHHDDFKGTISIQNETLSRLVYEVGMSVAKNGIQKLVIINAHGGNGPALNYAAQMINRDARIFVSVDTGETSDVDIDTVVETPNDVHAGEIETSTSLAVRPHLVRMAYAEKAVPEFSSRYLDFTSKRGISWYAYTRRISDSGVMGDPSKADPGKGERIWEMMIGHLVAFVEDVKRMTLDEIHQRRY